MITAETTFQHLAEGFPVGMRFHSAPVVRLADAKPVQLGHVARADGAWRVYVFADRDGSRQLFEFLASEAQRFTPRDAEPDSVIDVRAIFQQGHRDLDVDALPPVLLPRKGRFGLIDYEKAFCPDPDETSSRRAASTATAASSSSVPTSTSRTCCRCTSTRHCSAFFAGILIEARAV